MPFLLCSNYPSVNLRQYGKMYGGAKGIIAPSSLALPGHMAEESHTSTHMLIAADWNQAEAIPGAKSLSSVKQQGLFKMKQLLPF